MITPNYTGRAAIMSAYDTFTEKAPFWALYTGDNRTLRCKYMEGDAEEGKMFFISNLAAAEVAKDNNVYNIRFYKAKKKGRGELLQADTADIEATLPIRFVALNGESVQPDWQAGNPMDKDYKMYKLMDAMEKLPLMFEQQNQRIADLEAIIAESDEDVEEEDQIGGTIGAIKGLLDHPLAQLIVGQLFPNAMGNIRPAEGMRGTAVNGTTDDTVKTPPMPQNEPTEPREVNVELLNTAVQRLANYCYVDTDLNLLADYAEKNPAMFNMMLTTLRSQ